MFTCAAIKNGGSYLSEHLTANDYYAEKEQVVGQWIGEGAKLLKIEGQSIGPKDAYFEALRTNLHPQTKEPLTARTGQDRRAFYDFQCSAPKSVSIAAVTFGDGRLVEAHKEAVRTAFAELEKYAARRDRTGDKVHTQNAVITGNLVAAEFMHDASRELEAQLHTHLVCANATFDPKANQWFALENSEMFGAIQMAGRVYQAELAARCQALGYSIREDREKGVVKGFELEGISAEDCAKQSTRRAQIEAGIAKFTAEHGRAPTTKEIHVITTETREKKLKEITTPEVRAAQLAKYSAEDRTRLAGVIERAKSAPALAVDQGQGMERATRAIELAAEHLLERKAVVSRSDVLTLALQENLGSVSVAQLREAIAKAPHLIEMMPKDDLPADAALITSTTQTERELQSMKCIESTAGKFQPLQRGIQLSDTLQPDQRKAVEDIVASQDGVMAMLGRAGAGKTFTLREVDRLTREAGVVPMYTAPTHAAKEVLRDDGFQAETVTSLLAQVKRGQTSLAGRLLVVDEAGMLSTKQGTELLTAATKAGARVLLVGDEKQLLSVETGDWLGMLLKHSNMQRSVLSEIRRQQVAEYRAAMMQMSEGKVRDGLDALDKQGWVHEDGAGYLDAAAKSYLARIQTTDTAILVAPTWREIDRLNEIVRAELTARGTLQGQEVTREALDISDYTSAQRKVLKNYEIGMRVQAVNGVPGMKRNQWDVVTGIDRKTGKIELAHGAKVNVYDNGRNLQVARAINIGVKIGDTLLLQGNDKKLGVINGERVTVSKIAHDGIFVKQTRGRQAGREVFLPDRYKTFVHGYAVTAEKSQGATVTAAIVAGANLNGRRTYVATSRGRREIEVHVPDKVTATQKVTNEIAPEKAAMDYRAKPPVVEPADKTKEKANQAHGPATVEKVKAFVQAQRALLSRLVSTARTRAANIASRFRASGNDKSASHER